VGEEICSVRVSPSERRTYTALAFSWACAEGKGPRPREPFGIRSLWNSIPGRRFHPRGRVRVHPRGRVRGGFLPAPRSQAQCFFHLVQGTIVMARLAAERAGDPALGGARRSSDVQISFVADPIAVDERRARDASRTRKSTSSMIAVCRSEANVRGRLLSCSVASRSIIRLSPCSKMSAGLPGS
jgi:hypothetical protein